MNAKVADVMVESVLTTTRHKTLAHARKLMERHSIHALPIVDAKQTPIGILTSNDLIGDPSDQSRIDQVMTRNVVTIPLYNDVSQAARAMRNYGIHHLIVTHEQKIVGIVSSFDLLKLVEDHRFVAKNAPTGSKSRGSRGKNQGIS